MLCWSGRLIACVALVVGLTVTALPWWLQTGWGHRTVIQVAELTFAAGQLTVDRDAPVDATLLPPKE